MTNDADVPAMRRLQPLAVVVARFHEIDGGTLGAVVSVQLFTTSAGNSGWCIR